MKTGIKLLIIICHVLEVYHAAKWWDFTTFILSKFSKILLRVKLIDLQIFFVKLYNMYLLCMYVCTYVCMYVCICSVIFANAFSFAKFANYKGHNKILLCICYIVRFWCHGNSSSSGPLDTGLSVPATTAVTDHAFTRSALLADDATTALCWAYLFNALCLVVYLICTPSVLGLQGVHIR